MEAFKGLSKTAEDKRSVWPR